MSRNLKVACGSLGVSIVVLAMNAGTYWMTGSVASNSCGSAKASWLV